MKKNENLVTADEMIGIEIQKINAGNRNESNLLKFVFLTALKTELENSWARINSSREKEESQYIWRAVSNQIKWLKTLLLQGKSIAMTDDVNALTKMKASEEQIATLTFQRDEAKADYYRGVGDYDRIMKEQECFKSEGLYDSKIDMKANEILEIVKTFNEEEKLAFWLEYFKNADKFIYTPQIKSGEKGQLGE